MPAREVASELPQAERQALLQWSFTPEVRDQLETLAGRRGVDSHHAHGPSLAEQRSQSCHRQARPPRRHRHRPV